MGPNSKFAKELCEQLGIPYKVGPGFATFDGESLEGVDLDSLFLSENSYTPFYEDAYVKFQFNDFDLKNVIQKSFVVDQGTLSAA